MSRGSHRVGGCCWITWIRGPRISSGIAGVLPARAPVGRCTRAGGGRPGQRVERMMVMRRMVGIAAALALFGAAPLAAQYFGKNKVQYQAFDFKIIQTEQDRKSTRLNSSHGYISYAVFCLK